MRTKAVGKFVNLVGRVLLVGVLGTTSWLEIYKEFVEHSLRNLTEAQRPTNVMLPTPVHGEEPPLTAPQTVQGSMRVALPEVVALAGYVRASAHLLGAQLTMRT